MSCKVDYWEIYKNEKAKEKSLAFNILQSRIKTLTLEHQKKAKIMISPSTL